MRTSPARATDTGGMRYALIVHVCGVLVRVFGLMFLAPLAVALAYQEYRDAVGFAGAAVVTVTLGHVMRLAGGASAEEAVEKRYHLAKFTIPDSIEPEPRNLGEFCSYISKRIADEQSK